MEKEIIKKSTILKFAALTVAAFIAHFTAVYHNWYRTASWVDIPIHFWWGAMGALIFYWFFHHFPKYFDPERNFFITLVLVLNWTAFGGILWEFGEFVYDLIVITYGFDLKIVQSGLIDTLSDLLLNMLGGLTVALLMGLRYHKNKW